MSLAKTRWTVCSYCGVEGLPLHEISGQPWCVDSVSCEGRHVARTLERQRAAHERLAAVVALSPPSHPAPTALPERSRPPHVCGPGEALPHAPALWHAVGADGVLVVCVDPACPHEADPSPGGWQLATEGRQPRPPEGAA